MRKRQLVCAKILVSWAGVRIIVIFSVRISTEFKITVRLVLLFLVIMHFCIFLPSFIVAL